MRCPPVTTVLIRRPDLRYQLGFSVQNGIVSATRATPFCKCWQKRSHIQLLFLVLFFPQLVHSPKASLREGDKWMKTLSAPSLGRFPLSRGFCAILHGKRKAAEQRLALKAKSMTMQSGPPAAILVAGMSPPRAASSLGLQLSSWLYSEPLLSCHSPQAGQRELLTKLQAPQGSRVHPRPRSLPRAVVQE